jgi:hypothetical protein
MRGLGYSIFITASVTLGSKTPPVKLDLFTGRGWLYEGTWKEIETQ